MRENQSAADKKQKPSRKKNRFGDVDEVGDWRGWENVSFVCVGLQFSHAHRLPVFQTIRYSP